MRKRRRQPMSTGGKAMNFVAFVVVVIAGIALAFYYKSLELQRDNAEWQRMAGADAMVDVEQAINDQDYRFVGVNIEGHVLVPGIEDKSETERFGVRTVRGEGAFVDQSTGEQRVRQRVEIYMRNYNAILDEYIKKALPPM